MATRIHLDTCKCVLLLEGVGDEATFKSADPRCARHIEWPVEEIVTEHRRKNLAVAAVADAAGAEPGTSAGEYSRMASSKSTRAISAPTCVARPRTRSRPSAGSCGWPEMGKSLAGTAISYQFTTFAGSPQYLTPSCPQAGHDPDEAKFRQRVSVAGAFSRLGGVVDSQTGTRSVTFRINGVDSTLKDTIPSGFAGLSEDATHVENINAGDKVSLRVDFSVTFKLNFIRAVFEAAGGGHASLHSSAQIGNSFFVNSVATFFLPIAGATLPLATVEASAQQKIRAPGALKGLHFQCYFNQRTSASVIRSRVNGANGTLVVTIPASTTGFFEDTTHSDALADGDLVCWSWAVGAGSGNPATFLAGINCTIVNTPRRTISSAATTPRGWRRQPSSTTRSSATRCPLTPARRRRRSGTASAASPRNCGRTLPPTPIRKALS